MRQIFQVVYHWIKAMCLIALLTPTNDCACTWPSAFENSVWEGTRGQLTFGSSTLEGLVIDVSSLDPSAGSLSTWECVNTDYFQAEGIVLLKSTKKFNHINALFLAYFCFTMTRVTGVEAFYFYQSHAMEPSLNNERIKIHQAETFTTKAQICGATPPVQEFHYMVKQGQELVSKQFCPPSLLARMEYNVTSSNGVVSCTGPADSWDVCTDKTKMTFNYSTCATQMMYSSDGRVYCMFNLTTTHHYTMVYSNGTSGSKFICVVSNEAGTAASFVEGRCGQSNQSPTTFATSDGSDVGFTVTMSAAETCPFLEPTTSAVVTTTPTPGASSPSNTDIVPIIAGVVVCVLVALAIVGVVVYLFKCRKPAKVEPWEEKSGPPGETVNGYDVKQADGQGLSTAPNGTAGNPQDELTPVGDPENPALKEVQRQTLSPLPNSKASNGTIQPVIPPINNTV